MNEHLDTAARTEQTKVKRFAYSLAAGAAVTGATGADAGSPSIVYSGPQDISISQFGAQDLNLDGDGFTDILLKNYVFGGNYQGATVNGYPGQLVVSNAAFPYYVTALSAGDPIDAAAVGTSFYGSLAYGNNPGSEFDSAQGAFIGLSFPIGANAPEFLHYGWVRVTIDNTAGTFVINDWAYNSAQGVGLAAGELPEPSTLGLLAAGAAGVASLRRRRSAA